jgi:predicted amidophosphoribosyltransferase
VFCPKCGKAMELADGTFACVSGEMPLSQNLHDRLCEVFIRRTHSARSVTLNWGGSWFCPGCGVAAETGRAHVRCETCGEYLDEFLHALIELHPHRRPDGEGWR